MPGFIRQTDPFSLIEGLMGAVSGGGGVAALVVGVGTFGWFGACSCADDMFVALVVPTAAANRAHQTSR
jgi:hypothetical protein